jgi:hypothetical protein
MRRGFRDARPDRLDHLEHVLDLDIGGRNRAKHRHHVGVEGRLPFAAVLVVRPLAFVFGEIERGDRAHGNQAGGGGGFLPAFAEPLIDRIGPGCERPPCLVGLLPRLR